jgi:PAS domain S-box-containing protein
MVDGAGVIKLVNTQAERTFGYSREELLGHPVEMLLPERFRERHPGLRSGFLANPSVRAMGHGRDLFARRKDGTEFAVEIGLNPIPRGAEVLVLASIVDITQRKQVEAAERARATAEQLDRARSEFIATVSHEIRTPLNGVLGMAALLADTPLSGEQRELVTTVRSCGETLLSVVNDVLDYSKLDAGRVQIEAVQFSPTAVATDVLRMFQPAAASKALHLALCVDPRVPFHVVGDPHRWRQVIVNVLSNAIKFTPHGSVTACITMAPCAASGSVEPELEEAVLRCTVADTGVGMPPDVVSHLFQPFSQADKSTTRSFGGTGLGLAISKRLAVLMRGDISVASTPGRGSTFTVDVGVTVPQRDPELDASGLRIIVASADTAVRDSTVAHVSRCGAVCGAAADVDAAIAGATPHPGPTVLLVDTDLASDGALRSLLRWRQGPHLGSTRVAFMGATPTPPGPWHELGPVLGKPLTAGDVAQLLVGDATPPHSRRSSPGAAGSARGRVLVVDDNAINQRLAAAFLRKRGFEAVVAANGAAALELVRANALDLVLMDCEMPVMDGYAATQAIRADEAAAAAAGAAARHLPIVAMTASAMQGDRDKCLRTGMDDYIAKPMRLEDLDRALDKWLPGRAGE